MFVLKKGVRIFFYYCKGLAARIFYFSTYVVAEAIDK